MHGNKTPSFHWRSNIAGATQGCAPGRKGSPNFGAGGRGAAVAFPPWQDECRAVRRVGRRILMLRILLALAVSVSALAQDAKPLAALRLPLTIADVKTPEVKLDFEGDVSPETKAWAEEAAVQVREWWPQVVRMLSTQEFKSPEQFVLHFKKELKVPAYRTPEGLFISIAWITKRPDDFGMVIHEMTHAIQDYRRTPRDAGWLVEGIADYIRYYHYEPESPRPRFDVTKASYRDAYGTTAAFLAWAMHKYDRRLVRELDSALRRNDYTDALFEKITGKTVDVLWAEFIATKKN